MRILIGAASLGVALGLAAAPAVGQTPGFHLVGHAPGTNIGWVTALSQDGSVAAGYNFAAVPALGVGFRWTAAGGREDIAGAGAPRHVSVYGLDSGGGHLVGEMRDSPGFYHAFRASAGGGLVDLGVLPGHHSSSARGISGDGSVVVGFNMAGPNGSHQTGRAFRWTQQTGMQALPHLRPVTSRTEAFGISRDGTTIVGSSQAGGVGSGAPVEAFTWTQAGGMIALPRLPGALPTSWTGANAVSADGSIVVGYADGDLGRDRAVRWTPTGIEDLGHLPRSVHLRALAVSDDGEVIGGTMTTEEGSLAFVWTPATGLVSLLDYLGSSSVVVPPNWTLQYVYAVSGDGLTFAGEAVSTQGVRQGFVVTVPAPSAAFVILGPALLLARRRKREPGRVPGARA